MRCVQESQVNIGMQLHVQVEGALHAVDEVVPNIEQGVFCESMLLLDGALLFSVSRHRRGLKLCAECLPALGELFRVDEMLGNMATSESPAIGVYEEQCRRAWLDICGTVITADDVDWAGELGGGLNGLYKHRCLGHPH